MNGKYCFSQVYAFSAFTLLVGYQEEQTAGKNSEISFWGAYSSGARCKCDRCDHKRCFSWRHFY